MHNASDFAVELRGLGVTLEHPIMNAAGHIKKIEEVRKMAPSDVAAIVVGGITWEARDGNKGETFWHDPKGRFSLNSLGLPNGGHSYYEEELPRMVAVAEQRGKPLAVNVSGFSPEEFAKLAALCSACGVSWIEVNLGCPNIWDGGMQKRIVSFSPSGIETVLAHTSEILPAGKKVTVKLSPIGDPFLLEEICDVFVQSGIVGAVVGPNTMPNCFAFNKHGRQAISNGNGLAGMSGPAMKPVALGQVIQLRDLLPEEIDIIGVSGIESVQDVREFLQVGASAVQVGTAFFRKNDPRYFSGLLQEFVEDEDSQE